MTIVITILIILICAGVYLLLCGSGHNPEDDEEQIEYLKHWRDQHKK